MTGETADREDEYLSLSAAARLLGVHPSTVRVWADQGRVPVYRTQGGHRRFRKSEVRLWKQSLQDGDALSAERLLQRVLTGIRMQITEINLRAEGWYAKLDASARERCRQSGRALSAGLTRYLTTAAPQGEAQARATGHDYAVHGLRSGLSRMEATQAYLFFRGALLDSLHQAYEDARVTSPGAWGEMLRKTRCYTDGVLVALLEGYETPK